jgi:hypothetical protein
MKTKATISYSINWFSGRRYATIKGYPIEIGFLCKSYNDVGFKVVNWNMRTGESFMILFPEEEETDAYKKKIEKCLNDFLLKLWHIFEDDDPLPFSHPEPFCRQPNIHI